MKYLLILTTLLSLLSMTKANATDYYYCDCQSGASDQCVSGNDTNDGLTTISPKQSFSNASAKFSKLSAGDAIKFCRGGSFKASGKFDWVNNNCTAANTCDVTSFDLPGQDASPLSPPIINQTGNGHLFSLADGGASDHEEGYTFSDMDLRCTGCSLNGAVGFLISNDIDNVEINNVSLDGFNIGVSLQKNNGINTGDGVLDNITLERLSITNSLRQGIQGGANNLTISNSYFENNGSGDQFDHNIYISRGDNTIIRGNDLYRSSLDSNGSCAGAPIVVHGVINNLLIENNYVHEDLGKATRGCWGIAVDNGYSGAETFTNVIIRNNKVVNVGNLAIGVTSCNGCIIENNVIFNQQAFSFTAISAPNKIRSDNDSLLNNVTIRNNSIHTNIGGTGIKLGKEGTGHSVISNVITFTGTGNFDCFEFDQPPSSYTAIDNNTCYFPNAPTTEWEKGAGVSPTPLGAWQSQSGLGANSKNTNPEFNDPTLPLVDLSIKASSLLINAGHVSKSSSKDYRGKSRLASPDIGAFEFGTFDPPAKTNAYFD